MNTHAFERSVGTHARVIHLRGFAAIIRRAGRSARAPLLILAPLLLTTFSAHAQSYSITSATIINGGGGGPSSGTGVAGSFSVTGTLAQSDAHAASTGGSYSISGGFWSQYIALQTLGAPRLTIRPVGANIEVVWGSSVPGWVLQQNAFDLAPANWVDVAGAPTVSGLEQYHAFPASGVRVFYRLRLK